MKKVSIEASVLTAILGLFLVIFGDFYQKTPVFYGKTSLFWLGFTIISVSAYLIGILVYQRIKAKVQEKRRKLAKNINRE